MRREIARPVVPQFTRRRPPTSAAVPTSRTAGTPSQFTSATVRRSALLIVLGVATVVVRMHELIGPLRYIRPIFLVVVLLSVTTLAARRGAKLTASMFADPSLWLIYGYWAWMAVTIPTSVFRGQSVRVVADMTLVITFATMLVAQPPTVAQIRTITRGFFTVIAVFGLALILFGQAMVDVDGLRYAITHSLDPNDCAAILAIGAPMALAEARRKGSLIWRVACWVMFTIICLAVLRTASRGGLIALVAGVSLILLSSSGIRIVVSYAAVAVLLLVGRQFVPERFLPARLASIGSLSDDYNVNLYGGRVQIWKRGVQYFLQDPVAGVGVGGFEVREGQQMAEDGVPGKWSAPHSAYVQAFVELGLVGGLLFCGLIVFSIVRVSSIYRRVSPLTGTTHPEYLAAIAAFGLSAAFLSHAYFWGFFALVALCALAEKSLTTNTQRRPA